MTLTLNFDLLLKYLKLGHNFQTKRDRAFILEMCILCDKTSEILTSFITLTLTFDLFFENLYLGCYLVMVAPGKCRCLLTTLLNEYDKMFTKNIYGSFGIIIIRLISKLQ